MVAVEAPVDLFSDMNLPKESSSTFLTQSYILISVTWELLDRTKTFHFIVVTNV